MLMETNLPSKMESMMEQQQQPQQQRKSVGKNLDAMKDLHDEGEDVEDVFDGEFDEDELLTAPMFVVDAAKETFSLDDGSKSFSYNASEGDGEGEFGIFECEPRSSLAGSYSSFGCGGGGASGSPSVKQSISPRNRTPTKNRFSDYASSTMKEKFAGSSMEPLSLSSYASSSDNKAVSSHPSKLFVEEPVRPPSRPVMSGEYDNDDDLEPLKEMYPSVDDRGLTRNNNSTEVGGGVVPTTAGGDPLHSNNNSNPNCYKEQALVQTLDAVFQDEFQGQQHQPLPIHHAAHHQRSSPVRSSSSPTTHPAMTSLQSSTSLSMRMSSVDINENQGIGHKNNNNNEMNVYNGVGDSEPNHRRSPSRAFSTNSYFRPVGGQPIGAMPPLEDNDTMQPMLPAQQQHMLPVMPESGTMRPQQQMQQQHQMNQMQQQQFMQQHQMQQQNNNMQPQNNMQQQQQQRFMPNHQQQMMQTTPGMQGQMLNNGGMMPHQMQNQPHHRQQQMPGSMHPMNNNGMANFHQQQQQMQSFGNNQPMMNNSSHGEYNHQMNGNHNFVDGQHGGGFPQHHQQQGQSMFAGINSNMSIASEGQSPKPLLNGFGGDPQASPMSLGKPSSAPRMNDVMEKLSETMRRSAMTRSMVKQYSGHNLVRHSSMRGLMVKQGSARALMNGVANPGGMMMARHSSTRTLMRQGSDRSLAGDPNVPVRRMSVGNAKHHLQHPGRGLRRDDSQQSLNGRSNHNISIQIDGRNVGAF